MPTSASDPQLAQALTGEIVWLPVEHDWAFRAADAEGGFNRYKWGSIDQERFDACWDSNAEMVADDLIAAFGAMWPWSMPRAALTRSPTFSACVQGLADRREVGRGHTYRDKPDMVYEHAMMYGSFDHVRQAQGPEAWPPPPMLECPICGSAFSAAILSPWMIRQYGPPRFCNRCCVRARNGISHGGREAAVAGVRRLAESIDGIPEQSIAAQIALGGLIDGQRDVVMTGLIVAPAPVYAKAQIGGTWLRILQESGLVGDAWRPGRGTYCIAADGHQCRSLAERTVDDFLSSHRVPHDPEPSYPGSSRRADWRLSDGTLVEYAGLMSDAGYRAKIEEKLAIAAAASVALLVLLPEDLLSLSRVFGKWLSMAAAD
jgi:hypothetical protein